MKTKRVSLSAGFIGFDEAIKQYNEEVQETERLIELLKENNKQLEEWLKGVKW